MQAEQRNGEFIAQLEDRGRPLRQRLFCISIASKYGAEKDVR
jgi:hypothetical protein